MKLDWMMLANHAEEQNGLLYISGGAWDTVNAAAPLEFANQPTAIPSKPPVALLQGYLVARILFHPTETGREHTFAITLSDEDGNELQKVEGRMGLQKAPGLPIGWDQGANITLPITGTPVPKFGQFNYSLQVDEQHVGDKPFRVLKMY